MTSNHEKPNFIDWNGYQSWLREWKIVIKILADNCKKRKHNIRQANKENDFQKLASMRQKYAYDRIMVVKMTTLKDEGKIRWNNIKDMFNSIKEQSKQFPLEIKEARVAEFHFNKKHLEFPKIPMWVLKVRGKTYYIQSLSSEIGFSTKEKPDHPSTKGMIRFSKSTIFINDLAEAFVSHVERKD